MDEAEISSAVDACQQGNREFFTSIIQDYQSALYHFCYHFLGSRQDSEDASVDIFIKVYRSLGSFNPRYKFSTWLYKIAYNHLVEISRRKKRENRYFESEMVHGAEVVVQETPDSVFFKNADQEDVKNGLQSISPNSRTALMLRYYHQLSYREICQVMDIPLNTVASLIFRGKSELRKKLGREGI
jgi:RNA polymerase sigma-70 factor (ECF subfamily)